MHLGEKATHSVHDVPHIPQAHNLAIAEGNFCSHKTPQQVKRVKKSVALYLYHLVGSPYKHQRIKSQSGTEQSQPTSKTPGKHKTKSC